VLQVSRVFLLKQLAPFDSRKITDSKQTSGFGQQAIIGSEGLKAYHLYARSALPSNNRSDVRDFVPAYELIPQLLDFWRLRLFGRLISLQKFFDSPGSINSLHFLRPGPKMANRPSITG
jgi:hypothetical protein